VLFGVRDTQLVIHLQYTRNIHDGAQALSWRGTQNHLFTTEGGYLHNYIPL
jgi:hypothetical protein